MMRWQRGDTIIEVMLAVAVLGGVVVAAMSLMGRGTAFATQSLQTTLVRQEIDAQAESLRFLSAAYVSAYPNIQPDTAAAEYRDIINRVRAAQSAGKTSATNFGTRCWSGTSLPSGSFFVNSQQATLVEGTTATLVEADTYAQVRYNAAIQSQGVWVEGLRSAPANGVPYIDFYIRACWYAPGTENAMNLGTIVRLYEPTN